MTDETYPHISGSAFHPEYVSQICFNAPRAKKRAALTQPRVNARAVIEHPVNAAKKFRQLKANI